MTPRLLILLLAIIATTGPMSAHALETSLELGLQTSFLSESNVINRNVFYAEPEIKHEFAKYDATFSFEAGFRAWHDSNSRPANLERWSFGNPDTSASSLEAREIFVAMSRGVSRTAIGYQQISWGETFGFQILDIVNGRDLRDPLILETGWTRRTSPIVQQQFFLDAVTLQLIASLQPSLNILPVRDGAYDEVNAFGVHLRDQAKTFDGSSPTQPEFGGKFSYLHSSGLDLGFIYYEHYNRNVVYRFQQEAPSDPLVAQPIAARVKSAGLSASLALENLVLRMDTIAHVGQPLPGQMNDVVLDGTQFRGVVGLDWSQEAWTLGFQVQADINQAATPLLTKQSSWFSLQAQRRWLRDKIETGAFVFSGLDNQDVWIQPRISLLLSSNFSLALKYDYLAASASSANGILSQLREKDRLLTWATLKF